MQNDHINTEEGFLPPQKRSKPNPVDEGIEGDQGKPFFRFILLDENDCMIPERIDPQCHVLEIKSHHDQRIANHLESI